MATNSSIERLAARLGIGSGSRQIGRTTLVRLCAYYGVVLVVVAGFIATAEQWTAFEHDWRHILSMFGVSSLHMRHFAHSLGEYSSWKGDENRRKDFLSRLIGITKIRAQHSFAIAL